MTDDQYSQQGDYLASLSEDYYYATHPDPLHPMSEAEKAKAIQAYRNLTVTPSQPILGTSVKVNQ